MAATDKFIKAGNPGSATSLAAPGYTIGDTTITVVSTTNWPAGPAGCVFAIDVIGSDGLRVDGTYNVYQGTVATATSITNVSHISGTGTNRNYPAGTSTRVYIVVASEIQNRLVDGITTEHNQDGTHGAVTATSVSAPTISGTTSVSDAGQTLQTYRSEYLFDHVASGCVITGDAYGSTLKWSMTAGVVYIGGKRVAVSALSAQDVTASKDTYIDVSNTGTVTFTGGNSVANNAASPALAANSIRLGIIVSGANIASVASINQGQENKVLPIASSIAYTTTDSLGNLICPRDPNRKVLGYRQITSNASTSSATAVQVTGLTCPVIVPTGRQIKITAFSTTFGSAGTAVAEMWDGTVGSGTQVGQWNAGTGSGGMNLMTVTTPSSSSKTYNLGHRTTAGTAIMGAASTGPAYILVELA